MNENIEALKQGLDTANAKIDKIGTEVATLNTQVANIPGQPTPEEWADVKDKLSNLNTKLQIVDDMTADAPPADGGGTV